MQNLQSQCPKRSWTADYKIAVLGGIAAGSPRIYTNYFERVCLILPGGTASSGRPQPAHPPTHPGREGSGGTAVFWCCRPDVECRRNVLCVCVGRCTSILCVLYLLSRRAGLTMTDLIYRCRCLLTPGFDKTDKLTLLSVVYCTTVQERRGSRGPLHRTPPPSPHTALWRTLSGPSMVSGGPAPCYVYDSDAYLLTRRSSFRFIHAFRRCSLALASACGRGLAR